MWGPRHSVSTPTALYSHRKAIDQDMTGAACVFVLTVFCRGTRSDETLLEVRCSWSQTHSSNRELRKGLSWLKEQLRNVFWLLIDCERVINWAVIIRTLSKVFVHPWHLCQTARAGLKLELCAILPFPVYFLSGQQQIWSGILKCYCTTNTSICVSWALIASYLSVLTFSFLLKRTGCFVVDLTEEQRSYLNGPQF